MSLREPLAHLADGEGFEAFMHRVLEAGIEANPSRGLGRWRIEVVEGFGLDDGKARKGVALWIERGAGRSESWQRVSPTIYGDSWAELLEHVGKTIDDHKAALV